MNLPMNSAKQEDLLGFIGGSALLSHNTKNFTLERVRYDSSKMTFIFKKFALLAGALLATPLGADAAVIVSYVTANGATLPATTADSAVTADAVTRGTGLGQGSGGTFNSNGFSTTTTSFDEARTAGDVLEWGFDVNAGSTVDLTTLDIRLDRSGTGPPNFQITVSVNGGAASTILTEASLSSSGANFLGKDLSSVPLLNPGDSLVFTLAAFGATSGGGTFDLEAISAGPAITVNGNVGSSGGTTGAPGSTTPAAGTTTPAATTMAPPLSLTPIYEIQGEGHASPFAIGTFTIIEFLAEDRDVDPVTVRTSGIVTAVDSNGFYLQDPTGDSNIKTSDAIFVFTQSSPSVNVGDEVEVEGPVAEFFPGRRSSGNLPITQISRPPVVAVMTSGNTLPDPIIIGSGGRVPPNKDIDGSDGFATFDPVSDGVDFFESLEGMLVKAEDVVAVAGTTRFGEIFTVVNSGASASGLNSRGALVISPDDFGPEKIQIDPDSGIFAIDTPEVDAGDKLGDVTGVVSLSFGNFEILPTESFSVTSTANLQPETTSLSGGDDTLLVATYNILNLDPNDSDGDTDVSNGRFTAIASQIVNNLNTPDIIGLQEIQDNNGSDSGSVTAADETLQKLVDEIVSEGGPTYEFIDNTFIGVDTSGGQPGGNIRTTYLYNPARVSLVNVEPVGDQEGSSPFNGARLPLAATFMFNDAEVTVINNQFSSKGGSAALFGVLQPFQELQEDTDVNGSLDERQAQSAAVQSFVSDIFSEDSDANVIVLGDLNEFEFVSPVTGLETVGLTNLINDLPRLERYTFVFAGNAQVLDHILVSDALAGESDIDIVHVNIEFAETDERASDHDPVVATIRIVAPPDTPFLDFGEGLGNLAGDIFGGLAEAIARLGDLLATLFGRILG